MILEAPTSPAHVTFAIEKIQKEAATLWSNWARKKAESNTTLVRLRSDLQELNAVLAATETGYAAYLDLLETCRVHMQTADTVLAHGAGVLTIEAEESTLLTCTMVETERVQRYREVHRDKTAGIQRQSKKLYLGLQQEEKQVQAHATHLDQLLAEKKDQYQVLIRTYGPGL